MVNQETFLDKTNYNHYVFLRCVIIGFLAYFKDRIGWINGFENGPKVVIVPFHYSLTGQNRWLMDAFVDDIVDQRVNSNVDVIPRGAIDLTSWSFQLDKYCNPNIYINNQVDGDDFSLKEIIAQVKSVPIRLKFHIDIKVDTEIDQFKAWQSMAECLTLYKYFAYDFKRIPMKGIFSFPTDYSNVIPRVSENMGDVSDYRVPFDIDVDTFFPIFDYSSGFDANRGVQWILKQWLGDYVTENPEGVIPPELEDLTDGPE